MEAALVLSLGRQIVSIAFIMTLSVGEARSPGVCDSGKGRARLESALPTAVWKVFFVRWLVPTGAIVF